MHRSRILSFMIPSVRIHQEIHLNVGSPTHDKRDIESNVKPCSRTERLHLTRASKTTGRDEIAWCYRRLHKSRPEGKQSGPHYVSLRSGYRSRTSSPSLQQTNHRNHYIAGSRFRRLNEKGGEILLLGLCVCPQSLGNLGKRRSSFCTNYMHSCSNVNCKLTNSTCAFKGRPLVRM